MTGVIIWRPYFAILPDAGHPLRAARSRNLSHHSDPCHLIHMYMAFWVKGSIKGMIEGR
ncbi:hypothetical protein KIF59_02975 [Enterobacter cloacae subsp. cloacae]|nr:hypothetical protein [Enterobacter cloacae subsp. cloacae]